MARNDITIVSNVIAEATLNPIVASGVLKSINSGEPTKIGTAGAVAIMVDGDGTIGGSRFAGLAKSDSSDTVAAAGRVQIWIPLPGYIYSGKAKSSTAANTQAKIDALFAKRVIWDLTGSTWTVDSAASDATTNSLVIVGGDYFTNTLYFTICDGGTFLSDTTI